MSHGWNNKDGMGHMGTKSAYQHHTNDFLGSGSNFQSVGNVGVSPAGNALNQAIEHQKVFFGEPTQDYKAKLNSYNPEADLYEQENNDYPEAFSRAWGTGMNRNGHLSRVMLEKTKASECWQLTRMAPWMHHSDGGLEFSWEVRVHNDTEGGRRWFILSWSRLLNGVYSF